MGDTRFQRERGWKFVRLAAVAHVLNSCATRRLDPIGGTKDTHRNRPQRRTLPLFLDDSQNAIGITGTDGHSPLTHCSWKHREQPTQAPGVKSTSSTSKPCRMLRHEKRLCLCNREGAWRVAVRGTWERWREPITCTCIKTCVWHVDTPSTCPNRRPNKYSQLLEC